MTAKRDTAATSLRKKSAGGSGRVIAMNEPKYGAIADVPKEQGSLPDGWARLAIGDVGRWIGGGTPSKANVRFWAGEIPWVSPKDMKTDLIHDAQDHITADAVAESATNLVEAGSVLIVVRSGILQHTLPVAVTQREVAINQDIKAIMPRENVRADYLALALKAFEDNILHTCTKTGTTVQSLELPVFLKFQIPVPPVPEQRRLVAEVEKQFTRLEAAATALRRVRVNLKRYRAAVLKAACEGRLVATEAELPQARDREMPETGEALLSRILNERQQTVHGQEKSRAPAPPDIANLPPLPAAWTWATVEQLSDPEPNAITDGPFGSNLKTAHYTKHGPRVVRLQNIGDGAFVDASAHISNDHFLRLQKHRVVAGDVIIAGLGENLPRSCIIPESLGPAIVKADCIRLRTHPEISASFINAALNSEPVRRRTKNIVHGVGRPRLNLSEIKSIVLPLPPLPEQVRIMEEVDRRLSAIDELEATVASALTRARLLRLSILKTAFSGQLVAQEPANQAQVPDVKRIASRSMLPNRHFVRAVLSAEIVHRLHDEPTFGRVKHQKILHLCEYIAQLDEIGGEYHREAAGPLDNNLLYANVGELNKQKWYKEVSRERQGHSYIPLAKAGLHRKYVERYWPVQLSQIEKLIELTRKWTTEQCEIFSTTYAAWNDLIIWGEDPTDTAILGEILERWNDSKKQIPEERWRAAIAWISTKGLVPVGYGAPTVKLHVAAAP